MYKKVFFIILIFCSLFSVTLTNPIIQVEALEEVPPSEEEARATAIDRYFGAYELPLEGMGKVFVLAAKNNNLEWTILPAIAFLESTGGKFCSREYNPFGYGDREFANFEKAIATVAVSWANINSSGTEKQYREFVAAVKSYDPSNPSYSKELMAQMKKIEKIKKKIAEKRHNT